MKYLISSILVFAFICDLRAETPCELASPLMSVNMATCDGILMPKPWVEDCAVVKEVTLPKSLVNLQFCVAELEAMRSLFDERKLACEKTIAELEVIAREAANIDKPFELKLFVGWMSFGLVSGFALAYLVL